MRAGSMMSGRLVAPMIKTLFFGRHTVHFGQKLINHTVSGTPGVSRVASAARCDGIQFVEEQHTRRSRTGLIENLSDVRFRFSEPHGQQLWTFYGNKVRLALVCDGFGEEGFTASRRAVK